MSVKETKLELLFPTTVMTATLDRNFTKKEIAGVKKNFKEPVNNIGNWVSKDNYILNQPEFSNLKEILTTLVNDYIKKVCNPINNITGYITQSWLTFTNKNEFHHKHDHINSFLSGCLYINADPNYDKIYFHKDGKVLIQMPSKEVTLLNAGSWWLPAYTGGIIIFPSTLTHNVEKVVTDKTRICLSFNVFIKGTLGNTLALTELKLV
jgi:uncharacterized protein (TIGR02466 family)